MTAPLMTLRFTLPWPPSVNTYWRHIILGGKFKKARAQVILSEQGRKYRVDVQEVVMRQRVPRGAVRGRLAISIVAFPPDKRTRDLDNLLKGSLDGLKHAGVIADDGDIDNIQIVRGQVHKGGGLDIRLSETGRDRELQGGLELVEKQAAAAPF